MTRAFAELFGRKHNTRSGWDTAYLRLEADGDGVDRWLTLGNQRELSSRKYTTLSDVITPSVGDSQVAEADLHVRLEER